MRHKLIHPTDSKMVAHFGYDRSDINFWVEVRDGQGRLVQSYDGLTHGRTTPAGILRVLVRHKFFTEMDVHEAHALIQVMEVEEIEDLRVKAAAFVITSLKADSASGG